MISFIEKEKAFYPRNKAIWNEEKKQCWSCFKIERKHGGLQFDTYLISSFKNVCILLCPIGLTIIPHLPSHSSLSHQ